MPSIWYGQPYISYSSKLQSESSLQLHYDYYNSFLITTILLLLLLLLVVLFLLLLLLLEELGLGHRLI